MYARFFVKALRDLGLLDFDEPFARLFTQGMITRDGAKMSKSKGNMISPQTYIDRYGVDTARCYVMFIGPPDQDIDWRDDDIEGVAPLPVAAVAPVHARSRIGGARAPGVAGELTGDDLELVRKAHWAIDKVTHDMTGRASRSTPRSPAVMELVNECYRHRDTAAHDALHFAAATAASLIFPFAPHTGADAYDALTGARVWEEPWPAADPAYLERDTVDRSSCRSTARCATASRPPPGSAREDARGRARASSPNAARTSTATRSSRSSSSPTGSSTSSSAERRVRRADDPASHAARLGGWCRHVGHAGRRWCRRSDECLDAGQLVDLVDGTTGRRRDHVRAREPQRASIVGRLALVQAAGRGRRSARSRSERVRSGVLGVPADAANALKLTGAPNVITQSTADPVAASIASWPPEDSPSGTAAVLDHARRHGTTRRGTDSALIRHTLRVDRQTPVVGSCGRGVPDLPRSHLVVYALAAVAVLVFGVRQVGTSRARGAPAAEPIAVDRGGDAERRWAGRRPRRGRGAAARRLPAARGGAGRRRRAPRGRRAAARRT